jgi:hypothetical protein
MKSKYNKTKKKSYSHTGKNKIKKISKKTKCISIKTKLKGRSKRGGGKFLEKLGKFGTGFKAKVLRMNSAKAKYASILAKEEAVATKAAFEKAKELQSKVSSLGSKLGNHIHSNRSPLLAHFKASRDAKTEMTSAKSAFDTARQTLLKTPGDNIAMSVVTAQKALKAKSKAYEAAEKAAVEAEKLMMKAKQKSREQIKKELEKAKTELFKKGQIDGNTTKLLASVSSTPRATLDQQIKKHEADELLKLVKAGKLTREEKLKKIRDARKSMFLNVIKKEENNYTMNKK